ncbi:hypothetical protein [Streptomyces avermitilis]|uniref:hypothetical protein n=1 Tax=Streptomyces avermitilis TaxID=33903 RepID=UPI0037FA3D0D
MTVLMPWERLDGKVTGRHRDALAVVYVRQSTRQQVLDHGESTRLQYALVDRAVALGWLAADNHLLPIKVPISTSTPAATHASLVTCSFRLKRAHWFSCLAGYARRCPTGPRRAERCS